MVENLATGSPTKDTATADDCTKADSAIIKQMNKERLCSRLDSMTKKLNFLEKNLTATGKELIAAKAHGMLLANLALEQCKEGNLVHQQAEREMHAICKKLGYSQTRINDTIAEAHDKIIEEQVFNSVKAKSKAATAQNVIKSN
jgi:hypothetical protein